jgi:hypothetical protein
MSDPRKRRIRYAVRIRASSAEQKASSEVSRSIVLLSHLLGDGVLNGRLESELARRDLRQARSRPGLRLFSTQFSL